MHQIDFSNDLAYIHSTGLGSHIMGPWYLNAAKTNLFPNYPSNTAGTWAYFICIVPDGTPVYPYHLGRTYHGNPTGGSVTAITEPVATSVVGGPFTSDSVRSTTWVPATGEVTFSWNGAEGGSYRVEASDNLTSWNTLETGVTMTGNDQVGIGEIGATNTYSNRFYRAVRTGLATYDKTGFAGTYSTVSTPIGDGPTTVTRNIGNRGTVVSVVIELPLPVPQVGIGVTSITFGSGTGVTASAIARCSQTLMTATFTISAGARNVTVTFAGGVTRTITGGFTVQ